MFKEIKEVKDIDPMYVVFTDSSHADCDQGKSTACDLQCFQGGLIDHLSWVPNPVPLSAAESESNCYSAAIARSRYAFKAIMKILFGNPEHTYTVPILVDSSAAISMNTSDNPSRKTRHIEGRYWYGRQAIAQGHARLYKVQGDKYQPADIGTKNMSHMDTMFYRSLFESPTTQN